MSGGVRKVIRGEADFNIIGRSKVWAAISGTVLVLSLVGMFGPGLNLSLEFKGGTSLEAQIAPGKTTLSVTSVEDGLGRFHLGEIKVQVTGHGAPGDRVIVRSKHVPEAGRLREVQAALGALAGQTNIDNVSIQDVGPTWGSQVSSKALRGLIVFLILVTLYISFRFEPKMAAGALAALFHDLLATAGIYALIGFEVSPATVIALLTLLGYSLYDTVVVFDKVQENVGAAGTSGKITYTDLVNQSVNQVLMRSINTSLSTLLPIGALLSVGVFLFGAATLKDLALAMFMGTVVGTYSSIFVASPILAALKEREGRYRAIRARVSAPTKREARAPAAPAAVAPAAAEPSADGEGARTSVQTPARPTSSAMRMQGAAPRPRRQKRGKRR